MQLKNHCPRDYASTPEVVEEPRVVLQAGGALTGRTQAEEHRVVNRGDSLEQETGGLLEEETGVPPREAPAAG